MRALIDGFARKLNIGHGRHHDNRNAGMLPLQGVKSRQPSGQGHIEQDTVDRIRNAPIDHLHRSRYRSPMAVVGLQDFVAPHAKAFAQKRANLRIAVHDKNTPAASQCRVHRFDSCRPLHRANSSTDFRWFSCGQRPAEDGWIGTPPALRRARLGMGLGCVAWCFKMSGSRIAPQMIQRQPIKAPNPASY